MYKGPFTVKNSLHNLCNILKSTRMPNGPWNANLRQKIFKSSHFSLLYVQKATPGRSKFEGYSFKM